MDILDPHKNCKHRLFRESCIHHKGNYVKVITKVIQETKNDVVGPESAGQRFERFYNH